jgi:hypothetical protein
VGNHFFFRHFDQQPTSSIEQSRLAAISVALTFIFKACIIVSVATSFDQQMWFTFRQKALKVSHIEHIFTLPTNIFSLLHLDVIRIAPITWGLAVLCWIIPIVAIFPPGSIRVEGRSVTSLSQVAVPTFNGSNLSVSKVVELDGSSIGTYGGPAQVLKLSSTLTVLGRRIQQFQSPCGINCSYSLTFGGPAFQCRNATMDPMNPYLEGVTGGSWLEAGIIDYEFWLWYPHYTSPDHTFSRWNQLTQAIACKTYQAQYFADFRFLNEALFVDNIQVLHSSPLNWTSVYSGVDYEKPDFDWLSSNYAAISQSVISLLNGNVTYSSDTLL